MTHRAATNQRRAVTLLEVVLAMGLLVVLSSLTFSFYRSSLDSRDSMGAAADELRLAKAVLNRMAREIRQVSKVTAGGRIGIRGMPDRIWLSTLRTPTRPANPYELILEEQDDAPPAGEFDLVKIEYKIVSHPDLEHDDGYLLPLGLGRVEIRRPKKDSAETGEAFRDEDMPLEAELFDEEQDDFGDPIEEDTVEFLFDDEEEEVDPGIGPDIQWNELYAPEIRYLRFCYYDGNKWWNKWDIRGENPLPQVVQVTIGFDSRPAYGESVDLGEDEDLFCECLNSDEEMSEIEECEPFPPDTHTILVRVLQADTFFGSRIARETQSLVEEVGF